MNITRINIDALNAMLTVKVEKSDYESRVEATFREYRRKAQIPGFRPGMAPMGVIKKMYHKSVTADEVLKQVSEGINKYIEDNRLYILGHPIVNENSQPVDFDTQSDFEFTYDIALAPEVQLNIGKNTKIPYYTVAVTDDDVRKRISAYQTYQGKMIAAEKIEKDFLVRVDLTQGKENGHAVENALLALKVIPEAERQALLGLSVGDAVEVNIREMLANDLDCAACLKVTKGQLATIDPIFTLTVREITRIEPAKIDQNFFDELYGKDVVTSEEAFFERVKNELHSEILGKSEYRFASDIREALMKNAALELPEAFLKRWLLLTSDEKITEELMEERFPPIAEKLCWQLIKEHILQQENITVSEEDLLHVARRTVLRRLAMFGPNNISEERLNEFAHTMINNSDERKRFFEHATTTHVMEYVRNIVTVEEKKVSNEELRSLADTAELA
ncbi:MAG: trigger factor [Prevotellaceae bacterium]|jgi:trigger factor|nr:trigger factor [Prevotellaceae bacterium]